MKPLRIGFIGAGRWMRWYHLPTMQCLAATERVVPTVIWNRTRSKAEELASTFDIHAVADSVADLLTNYDIDGVIIAVSRESAASMVRAASDAGVPFLVEKPPADSLEDARELDRIVTAPNLVAFNRVFSPVMVRLKEVLSEAHPYHMHCVFSRRHRTDALFVFETGIHAIMNGESLFGPGRLLSTTETPIGENVTLWRATIVHAPCAVAPQGVTVDYVFAPWSGRAVERYTLIGPESTVELFVNQHYAPDDNERIEISSAVEDDLRYAMWKPDDIPELERAGYAGEHRAFYRLVRNPKEQVFPDIHKTVELMAMAERINGRSV